MLTLALLLKIQIIKDLAAARFNVIKLRILSLLRTRNECGNDKALNKVNLLILTRLLHLPIVIGILAMTLKIIDFTS